MRNLRFIANSSFSGEGGIRTPGTFQFNSFQDCRNRPLYHLSSSKRIANLDIIFTNAKNFSFYNGQFPSSCSPEVPELTILWIMNLSPVSKNPDLLTKPVFQSPAVSKNLDLLTKPVFQSPVVSKNLDLLTEPLIKTYYTSAPPSVCSR